MSRLAVLFLAVLLAFAAVQGRSLRAVNDSIVDQTSADPAKASENTDTFSSSGNSGPSVADDVSNNGNTSVANPTPSDTAGNSKDNTPSGDSSAAGNNDVNNKIYLPSITSDGNSDASASNDDSSAYAGRSANGASSTSTGFNSGEKVVEIIFNPAVATNAIDSGMQHGLAVASNIGAEFANGVAPIAGLAKKVVGAGLAMENVKMKMIGNIGNGMAKQVLGMAGRFGDMADHLQKMSQLSDHSTDGSGTNGGKGASETNGSKGASGTNGGNAASKTDGGNAASGTDGGNAASRTNGSNEASGTNGSNEASGTNGSNETSGTTETKGSSGRSGTKGINGASGSNGANLMNMANGQGFINLGAGMAAGGVETAKDVMGMARKATKMAGELPGMMQKIDASKNGGYIVGGNTLMEKIKDDISKNGVSIDANSLEKCTEEVTKNGGYIDMSVSEL